ncbi:MAG TPA: lytic transglycosylase domain-containing protein [Negativicutes bacterium]|nr:lytic transglycosylase domain-containing protein [Negativicutes bacterium]
MESVQRVMRRIAAIEQRFQPTQPQVDTASFAAAMSKAENSAAPARQTGAGSRQEIAAMVQAAARKYNVDAKLAVAVAVAESDLTPNAVSSAGATGVMQLMPATARSLGVGNVFDPRENIDGGVRYLKQMLDTFGGDVTKAVAAYNSGPEAVQRYAGVPPYPETRAYVSKVLSMSG